MFDYRCTVHRVLDGDTVEVTIDLGFDCRYHSPARLKGLNAPELRGDSAAAGLAAREYLTGLLQAGPVIILTELRKDKDKYGRVLGTLWVNGQNINQAMLDAGHAVPYMT